MNKAVFLDRDGTINVDRGYIGSKEQFEFIPGVIEALKLLQEEGFLLIIITNQSGIARGYYTEEMYLKLNSWMLNHLEVRHIRITEVFYCPHYPMAIYPKYRLKCNCRKPNLGLFWKAIHKYAINVSESYAIGDKLIDCELCKISDCKGFLVGNSENKNVIQDVMQGKVSGVEYQENLIQCALKICRI